MTGRPILPTPLVSTDWLAKHLGDPDLRVLDATAHLAGPEPGSAVGWSLLPGLDDYVAAHVPGAASADIIDDLSEPDWRAQQAFPGAARRGGRPAGIGPVSWVVVYALDVHWHPTVAVLAGFGWPLPLGEMGEGPRQPGAIDEDVELLVVESDHPGDGRDLA
jgi:3-mercaptopyruvate sulfurtransferase SseA